MAGDIVAHIVGMVLQLTQEVWCHLFMEHYRMILFSYIMEMSPDRVTVFTDSFSSWAIQGMWNLLGNPLVVAPVTLIL